MNLLLDARRILFYDLIDDARLCDGASLETAVAAYRKTVAARSGWVAGRFQCPTSQLENLAGLLTTSMTAAEPRWRVSAVFDEPAGTAALHAVVFDRYMDPAGAVVVAETDVGGPTDFGAAATAALGISQQVVPFLVVNDNAVDAIGAIDTLHRQRLRPIGAVIDAATSITETASFVAGCIARGVPFKLAGAFRPVRHDDRPGVLNVLAATALAHAGAHDKTLRDVLADQNAAAFTVTAVGLRWRERLVAVPQLRETRRSLVAVSCADFAATIADLEAMHLL